MRWGTKPALRYPSLIIQRFVKKLLAGLSMDQLKLTEFDMFLEGSFNTADDQEVKILFVFLISGLRNRRTRQDPS